MHKYRSDLPQLDNNIFLMDGGMETDLIFQRNIEVPHFAIFDLLSIPKGRKILQDYYIPYIQLAQQQKRGFIMESPTWRANPAWGPILGYNNDQLKAANIESINLMQEVREEYETTTAPLVISGCIGPHGDGYVISDKLSVEQAQEHHSFQINILANTSADFISFLTINYVEEAIGATLAAADANMPIAISFTTETDGKLPSGMDLGEAIETVDAMTNSYPAYYKINCSHPQHFSQALFAKEPWVKRVRALRANASCKSHAELDNSPTLDRGNPLELGQSYRHLREVFPNFTILGGCCGTDIEHITAIAEAC